MTFEEAENRYLILQQQWQAGQLTTEQFHTAVYALRVQMPDGTWWQIHSQDGSWLRWNGAAWEAAVRPQSLPVSPEEAASPVTGWHLQVIGTEARYPLVPQTWLGRGASATIALTDLKVSRQHARLQQRGDTWLIADQSSINGTLVNGERILQETPLQAGDIIQVGDTQLLLVSEAAAAPPEAAVSAAPRPETPAATPAYSPPIERPQRSPKPIEAAPLPLPSEEHRSRWPSCLGMLALFILIVGALSMAGYYLLSEGIVDRRNVLAATGQEAGEIMIINAADETLDVSLTRLDMDTDESDLEGSEFIDPLDISGFGGIEPGRYELVIASSSSASVWVCTLQIVPGDLYEFMAVAEGVAVTREGYAPPQANELDVETSSLCQ